MRWAYGGWTNRTAHRSGSLTTTARAGRNSRRAGWSWLRTNVRDVLAEDVEGREADGRMMGRGKEGRRGRVERARGWLWLARGSRTSSPTTTHRRFPFQALSQRRSHSQKTLDRRGKTRLRNVCDLCCGGCQRRGPCGSVCRPRAAAEMIITRGITPSVAATPALPHAGRCSKYSSSFSCHR